MAYSLYDAAVTPCAQQLGALVGIIDKAAAHCATNKIEESAGVSAAEWLASGAALSKPRSIKPSRRGASVRGGRGHGAIKAAH
jgi:hypothetical protein